MAPGTFLRDRPSQPLRIERLLAVTARSWGLRWPLARVELPA
ncbi:hypothetical protein [Ramlibacter paludis]|nr:hypothetical protein [Ramlibacter paludis]